MKPSPARSRATPAPVRSESEHGLMPQLSGARFSVHPTPPPRYVCPFLAVALLRHYVYSGVMSPKTRFQVMLDPPQLEAMRVIEQRTGAPVARQIRMAVDRWLDAAGARAQEQHGRADDRDARRPRPSRRQSRRSVVRDVARRDRSFGASDF